MRPSFGLLLVVAVLACAPVAAEEQAPRITVIGEGRSEAAPDLARFFAGVATEAARAEEAYGATAVAMQAVFAALKAAGIAPGDMQTTELSVEPLWTEGEAQPRVRGFSATSMVAVQVRDVSRLGAVIDASAAAGANRVYGIGFELAEPRAGLDAARRSAVMDARAKADLLAAAAGVTLGSVLSIREGGEAGPGPILARMEAAADMPVAEGVVSLEARVEIVYSIE